LAAYNGPFRWLLNCQDHAGKFICTRALTKKTVKEVAHALLDIFTTIGPPAILQSDNGREFSNMASTRRSVEEENEDQLPRVVAFDDEELKKICRLIADMWPGTVIVHGKPRRSTTQGSIERSNQHIEVKLSHWMRDNDSKIWSIGHMLVRAWIKQEEAGQEDAKADRY
jgi:transposase InsO family protein